MTLYCNTAIVIKLFWLKRVTELMFDDASQVIDSSSLAARIFFIAEEARGLPWPSPISPEDAEAPDWLLWSRARVPVAGVHCRNLELPERSDTMLNTASVYFLTAVLKLVFIRDCYSDFISL